MTSLPESVFHDQRFVKTPSGWLVRTREAGMLGPFSDRRAAEQALSDHINTASSSPQTLPLGMDIHEVGNCRVPWCELCQEAHQAIDRILGRALGC